MTPEQAEANGTPVAVLRPRPVHKPLSLKQRFRSVLRPFVGIQEIDAACLPL